MNKRRTSLLTVRISEGMKQIIENRYLKTFSFSSFKEASVFFNNQKTKNKLFIEDTFGDSYYCYLCCHSLTAEIAFILLFSSDKSKDDLNFLFWNNLITIDTGKKIYLIDENLSIKASLEINTALVGLYLINNEKLLILEEAGMMVINSRGEIVKSDLFDLMEDFSIKDNLLFIQTSEENKVIELT